MEDICGLRKLILVFEFVLFLLVSVACNVERSTSTVEAVSIVSTTYSTLLSPLKQSPLATITIAPTVTITPTRFSATTPTLVPTVIATSTPLLTVPIAKMIKTNTVAFIVSDWKGNEPDSLWIANIDGSGEMKLLDEVYQVAWAPNGRWLSCIRNDGLWVISPDGTTQVKILAGDEQRGNIVQLAWSPDSTKIAFIQTKGFGETSYLGIADVTNKQIIYLMDDPNNFFSLAWAPNGQWVAFVEEGYRIEVINVINAEFITLQESIFCGGSKEMLTWSPESDRIALLSFGNGRYAQGTVCLSTLTGYTTKLEVGGHSTNPVWAADGRGLYVLAVNPNPDDEPNFEANPRLLYFDNSGLFVKRIDSVEYVGVNALETLTLSPDGRWLASMVLDHSNNVIQFINVAENKILTRTVDVPGDLLYAASPKNLYKWSGDSQNVILMIGKYSTPDEIGVRQYGVLYALSFESREWRQLTQSHWIKQYVTSPVSLN